MLNGTTSLMLVSGLLAGFNAPAAAQFRYDYGAEALLSPRDVIETLRDQGFRSFTRPRLNRDVYVLNAIDPYDVPVRLIVSAHDGAILEAFRERRRGGSRVIVDPEVDDDNPKVESTPPPRNEPPRARPRPAPQAREVPPQPANPDLGPRAPTTTKRSPLAIPRDGTGEPPPGAGTRSQPRVIPMTPGVTAPSSKVEPQAPPSPSLPPPAPPLAEAPARPVIDMPPQVREVPRLREPEAGSPADTPRVLDFRGNRNPSDGQPIPAAPLE